MQCFSLTFHTMQQMRNDPDGEANQAATRSNERAVFAAKMQAQTAAERNGLSVVEANRIQSAWRNLPHNATPSAIDRMSDAMGRLPQSYLAVHGDDTATVMRLAPKSRSSRRAWTRSTAARSSSWRPIIPCSGS